MLKRSLLTLLSLAVVCGGLLAVKQSRTIQVSTGAATTTPPTPVAVAAAIMGPLPRSLGAIGTIEAVQQVMIAPEVGGRTVALYFASGGVVRAGDPLVQLNDAPERGDLVRFRATAQLAERELVRVKSVTDSRAVAQRDVDVQQGRLDEARGDILRTEALIAQKLIRAPFSGILGVRKTHLGEYLQPGQPIITLTALETLYVNFTLPEQALSQLAPRQSVDFRVDAYPNRVFTAELTSIEAQVAAETRTVTVQATCENRTHLLRPGMFANVQVVLPPEPNVVTVPETAVDRTLYGEAVFVVRQTQSEEHGQPHYTVERVLAKTGRRVDGRVVLLEGVAPGELVVASGQVDLANGASVSIAPADTLTTMPSSPMVPSSVAARPLVE
jgi:multidrug efflux system membrane fusion protein